MKKLYMSLAFATMSLGAFAQTETVFANAETATPGFYTWDKVNHTVTVVDNPLVDAVNGTSKVYYFNGGAWGGMANWNDAGTTIKAEYTTLVFDVYVVSFTAGTKAYFKTQCDNSLSSAANLDKGKDVNVAGKWVTVTIDISSKVASDYKQFAIQSENAQYYIDNIKFISPTSTGVKTASTGVELIATQGGVSVKNAEGQAIQIYNLAGAKINSSVAQSSDEVISLSKGIYVVTVGGKSSKVCVK